MNDIWLELMRWTPSFAVGFSFNLLISFVAMFAGTVIGLVLARGRLLPQKNISVISYLATGLFRNIPSFVFMFYIAFIIPVEFEWMGETVRFPPWVKASIALTVPVVGFASDQFYRLFGELKSGNAIALPMFLVSWIQYFVIILMASSTASVIGVHEIVGRANTAIAVTRDPEVMLWIYMYVAAWFLIAAIMSNVLLKWLTDIIHRAANKKRQSVL